MVFVDRWLLAEAVLLLFAARASCASQTCRPRRAMSPPGVRDYGER